MKLRQNQAGFSPLVIGTVVAVLGLTGLSGWFIYNRQHKADNKPSSDTHKAITNFDECVAAGNAVMESYPEQCAADGKTFTNDKQKAPAAPVTDETANWLLYTAKDKSFTIRLADGWVVEDDYYSQGFNTFNNKNLAPKTGTKAIVNPYPGGKDGQTGLFLNYATQNIEQIVTPGEKQTGLKTTDGLDIEKYYYVQPANQDGIGLQQGDIQYTYVIRKSASRVIIINYSFSPGATDYHDTVEKVAKTAHFN